MKRKSQLLSHVLAFIAVICSGCCCLNPFSNAIQQAQQAAVQTQGRNDLKELALAYHLHHDNNGVGPANWSELLATADEMSPDNGLRRLQSQGVVVAFGYKFKDVTIGISNFVLAYSPSVMGGGGDVVMMDGSVRNVSASELADMLSDQASVQPSGL